MHLILQRVFVFLPALLRSKYCDHIVIPHASDTSYYNCELTHFQTFKAKTAWQRGTNVCRHTQQQRNRVTLLKNIQRDGRERRLKETSDGRVTHGR